MKRMLMVLSVGIAMLSTIQADAVVSATTYSVAQATATPQSSCDTGTCGVTGYTYSGDGACTAGCAGYPTDPLRVLLGFSATRFFAGDPSRCRMRSGSGSFDAAWPTDPLTPSAQGTFSFKARDSKAIALSGTISSSTVSRLHPGDAVKGFVTFPPNPCLGGPAQISLTFTTTS